MPSDLAAAPQALGAPLFAVGVGLPIAIGSAQLVEKVNSALVGGVVLAFGALLFLGVPQVQPELLAYADAPEVINPNPNPNPSPNPNPNPNPNPDPNPRWWWRCR